VLQGDGEIKFIKKTRKITAQIQEVWQKPNNVCIRT